MAECGALIDLSSPRPGTLGPSDLRPNPGISLLALASDSPEVVNNPFDEVALLIEVNDAAAPVDRKSEAKSKPKSKSTTEALTVVASPAPRLEASLSGFDQTTNSGGSLLRHTLLTTASNGTLERAFVTSRSISASSQGTEFEDDVFTPERKESSARQILAKADFSDWQLLIDPSGPCEDLASIPPPPLWDETAELDKFDEMGLPMLDVGGGPVERPPSPLPRTPLPEESDALKRYKRKKRASLDASQPPEGDDGQQGSSVIRRALSDSSLAGGEGGEGHLCPEETVVLSQRVPAAAADCASIRLKKLTLEGAKRGPLKAVVPLKNMVLHKGSTGDRKSPKGSHASSVSPSSFTLHRPGNRLNTANLRKDSTLNLSGAAPVASSTPHRLPFAFLRSKSDQAILQQQASAGTPKRSGRVESRSGSTGSSKRSSSIGGTPSIGVSGGTNSSFELEKQGRQSGRPSQGTPKTNQQNPGAIRSVAGSRVAPSANQRPRSAPSLGSSPLRSLNQLGARKLPPKKTPAQVLSKLNRVHSNRSLGKENA